MIDGKYEFIAINPVTGNEYSEKDALIWRADCIWIGTLLELYRISCIRLLTSAIHVDNIDMLITRVTEYQKNEYSRGKFRIDYKFDIYGIRLADAAEYTSNNAIIFCAKDRALIYALNLLIQHCIDMEADGGYVDSLYQLLNKIREFQHIFGNKLPTTTTEEFSRNPALP